MNINKIILFEDNKTTYNILTYKSSQLCKLDLTLGDTKVLFDNELFEDLSFETVKSSLYPSQRVRPISLDDLSETTLVLIRLRENHFLINTTLSHDDINKEVFFDTNRNRLVYAFFNFSKKTLSIRSRISENKIGILEKFKEDLTNNILRQTLLNFFQKETPPTEDLNKLLLSTTKNTIIFAGEFFRIKFNDNSELILQDSEGLRDLIYIIKHVESMDCNAFWKRFRGKPGTNDETAYYNLDKNFKRLKERIKRAEEKLNIKKECSFYDFINYNIKISMDAQVITNRSFNKTKWGYDLPPEFNLYTELQH
jgi:hypothetical protein